MLEVTLALDLGSERDEQIVAQNLASNISECAEADAAELVDLPVQKMVVRWRVNDREWHDYIDTDAGVVPA